MLCNGQALRLKNLQRIPYRHSRHTEVIHENRFRRKPLSFRQLSPLDGSAQLISNLTEYGPITCRIDG
jgi:hypothetical protein